MGTWRPVYLVFPPLPQHMQMMTATDFILIPAYNEAADVLISVLNSLLPTGATIIVIDDGSRIPLAEVLPPELQKRLVILRHKANAGQGRALETGMEYARTHGAEFVYHLDADGQHETADLPLFQKALKEGYDFAVGSRFLDETARKQIPWSRRILLQLARFVNACFTGRLYTDAHNGFRAMNQKALLAIHLKEPRMAHATEILCQAQKNRLKICEIPVHVRYTEYSRNKGQKWYHALLVLKELIRYKFFSR